jgi:hypothetical protein
VNTFESDKCAYILRLPSESSLNLQLEYCILV